MTRDSSQEGRTILEWVSCPHCGTTFRVAIPTHYGALDILQRKDDREDVDEWQRVRCANQRCKPGTFVLALYLGEDE